MVKPSIGVTLSSTRSRWIWPLHWLAIWRAGGKATKITPKGTNRYQEQSGYVIGGGDDISFHLDQHGLDPTIRYDPERDALEKQVLEHAFKERKPVLGICRGAQMINIVRGGDLYADLSDFSAKLDRGRTALPRTQIEIRTPTKLHDILNRKKMYVNTLHHQSINHLGCGLEVAARDSAGIVQAIECNSGKNVIGVQWHPELIPYSPTHQALFKNLVADCKEDRPARLTHFNH